MQNLAVGVLIILSLMFTMGKSKAFQKLAAVLFLIAFCIVYRSS